MPHKGSPHSATASAAPGCDASTKHLSCRVLSALHTPHCSSSPWDPAFHPSFQGPKTGNPSPCGSWQSQRDSACCPLPKQTGSPLCPGHSGQGPLHTANTTACSAHGLQKTCPALGNAREKINLFFKQKTKGSTLPKHCLHKSLSFSFFLEAVEYCSFSTLSEATFLEKLLFLRQQVADIFGKLKANCITAGGHLRRGVDEIGGGQRWAAKASVGRRCHLPAAPTPQYCVQRSGLNHPRLIGEPAVAGCQLPEPP